MSGERRWIRVAIEGGFSSSSRSTLVAFGFSFCSPACDAAGIASPSPFLPSWRLQPTYLHRLFVHLLSPFLIDAGSLPFAFPAVNTIVLSFPRPSETSYIRLSLYPEEQREDSFLRVSLLRPQLPKSAELCFQGRSSISVFLSCSPSRQETFYRSSHAPREQGAPQRRHSGLTPTSPSPMSSAATVLLQSRRSKSPALTTTTTIPSASAPPSSTRHTTNPSTPLAATASPSISTSLARYLSVAEQDAYEVNSIDFSTASRVYCSKPTCSEFLGPTSETSFALRCGKCGL